MVIIRVSRQNREHTFQTEINSLGAGTINFGSFSGDVISTAEVLQHCNFFKPFDMDRWFFRVTQNSYDGNCIMGMRRNLATVGTGITLAPAAVGFFEEIFTPIIQYTRLDEYDFILDPSAATVGLLRVRGITVRVFY